MSKNVLRYDERSSAKMSGTMGYKQIIWIENH